MPGWSSEKVFGAAAISRTRVATCAAKRADEDDDQQPEDQRRHLALRGYSFKRVDHRRHDLEQIADDAEVGDFEDRRVGILVDRDDGAGALHADQVLNRAGDAERQIQLRRDGLPGAADLPLHRQPAGVADRPRRGQLGAERLGQLLRERDVRLLLDAAADRDDPLGLRQVDRLLRFLERRLGLLADARRLD